MLHRAVVFIALSLGLVGTASAQAPDFKEMGRISLAIDGEQHDLIVPWEAARERGRARISKRLSTQIIDIAAVSVSENGAPGFPMLSLSFTVSKGGAQAGQPVLVSMELTDGQGIAMPAVANLELGSVTLSQLDLVGQDSVAFSFAGELIREDRSDIANMRPVENAAPVVVTGSAATIFSEPE